MNPAEGLQVIGEIKLRYSLALARAISASGMARLRDSLYKIYGGQSDFSRRARFTLLGFDVFIISFFVLSTFLSPAPWITVVDFVIGLLLLMEFLARFYISHDKPHFLLHATTLADVVVIVSLLTQAITESFAFLRVLRALRLLRSYHMLHELRSHSKFFARNEEIVFSVVNLFVFIFMVSALVYVLQVHANPGISNYIDALYFTITTLTTTGFGDITLVGDAGRLLAIVIMIVGISLFLRLIQTTLRARKVRYECPSCGLTRHETDAVHCKHCGALLHITTAGADDIGR